MKALSIRQPWANQVVSGEKAIEYRAWATDYRGPLLICASKTPDEGGERLPLGVAVGVVELSDIRFDGDSGFEWILKNPRKIEPFPVRGKLKLFDVDFTE